MFVGTVEHLTKQHWLETYNVRGLSNGICVGYGRKVCDTCMKICCIYRYMINLIVTSRSLGTITVQIINENIILLYKEIYFYSAFLRKGHFVAV